VAIAERLGVSEARVLLRYALQKEWAVLPKSLNAGRITENIDLGSFSLAEAEMAQLDAMETGVALAWGQPGQPMDPLCSE
jgi:2,5-diketo-D-gluconate reductase A